MTRQAMINPNQTLEQSLFNDVKKRAVEQGIESYDEYIDLVEEVVQEKLEDGVLTKHDDLTQLQGDIEHRWPEVEEAVRGRE